MAVIAVAGGTGNVGRAIVEAIVATGKHQVKILSRKSNPELEVEIGVPILAVDYSKVDDVVKVLEENNIHTVVSGVATHSEDGTVPHEIELIRAADLSKTTKRLISSEWGVPKKEEHIGAIPSVIHKLNAKKELERTKDLEYTVFYNGYFMDYWGFPGVKSNLIRMPIVFWLDMDNNVAAIPGSGNTPVIFTHTTDVAKFVAASLDLPKWETETFVSGDKVTWNEFVAWAEEAKGTKFNVAHDSVEKLKLGQPTELPAQVPLYQFFPKPALQGMAASFGLWFEEGMFDLKPARFLNEVFPEIKPLKVKEMLDKAWRRT